MQVRIAITEYAVLLALTSLVGGAVLNTGGLSDSVEAKVAALVNTLSGAGGSSGESQSGADSTSHTFTIEGY